MAEGTPDTHWRVSQLRTNPIIGLDLRAGTLKGFYADFAAFTFVTLLRSIAYVGLGAYWRSLL
jgi:hypothetical protein